MTWQARVVHRPSVAPQQPHCSACLLTLKYLQTRQDEYECSRIECPRRRACTAQAPAQRGGVQDGAE